MADTLKIAPELQNRIASLAARSHRSAEAVVTDALEHGLSLDWQESFVEKVRAGLEDAAAGRVATPEDFERLREKYRRG